MHEHVLVFDGAMGTMLQARGFRGPALPETLNESDPALVLGIHRAYAEAGADVITANTFQANRVKLGDRAADAIRAGVALAKQAGARFTALDVGPLGQVLKPLGALDFEDAYDMFAEQMRAGRDAGADVILIETFSDIHEAKAAILAAKEYTDLPIFCSMSYQAGGRTFMGLPAAAAAVALQALGVAALGANCSLPPAQLTPVVDALLQYARVPVLVQANAGMPVMRDGEATYDMSAEAYVSPVIEMMRAGVRVVGGCCGTTPETIRALKRAAERIGAREAAAPRAVACASASRLVEFGGAPVCIGGRLNPVGRPDLTDALAREDYGALIDEAMDQEDEGAQVLSLRVAAPGVDEARAQPRAFGVLQGVCAAPPSRHAASAEALEAGLRAYRGRPILNAIPCVEADMARLFPLAKKYGALAVVVTRDENGVPETADERLEIARRLLAAARAHGLDGTDLLVDCAAHAPEQREAALKAAALIKRELGLVTLP
jgi:5-methyltetrahydrofolate--homocysteine methyltransferase